MIRKTNGYLETYAEKCFSGKIVASEETKIILWRLLKDMKDPLYVYDTSEADKIIDFIENCMRKNKEPFHVYHRNLWEVEKAYISAVYGFKIRYTGKERFERDAKK